METGKDAADIVAEKGLEQVTDTGAIEAEVDRIVADKPQAGGRIPGRQPEGHGLVSSARS